MQRLVLALGFCPGLLALLCAQPTPGLVDQVQVTGARQSLAGAISAIAGVVPGQPFSREALDTGAKRLFETGLFSSVNYRYSPGRNGTQVTWEVQEASPEVAVRIDIPGLDDGTIWNEAVASQPLLSRPLPRGDLAASWCLGLLTPAVHRHGVAGPVLFDTGADGASGQITLFLRLADAPEVSGFEFTGNKVLNAKLLAEALRGVVGRKFSEYETREALETNVRPLYEEKGHLRIAFGQIAPGKKAGSVSVAIEEGRPWTLRQVRFTGDGAVPEAMARAGTYGAGQLADWKQIQAALDASHEVLVSRGYLRAKLTPERFFDEANGTVDLEVRVDHGLRFRFGRLVLAGVPPELLSKVQGLWKLGSGAPMDGSYVHEYLRQAFQVLGDTVAGVTQNVVPGAEQDVMDVHITFRPADH